MKKLTTYDPKKHKTVLVGYIDGTTLKMKKNRKKHFMRVVDGYGIQADALYQLKDLGIDKIIIEESDTGISWQSSPDKWRMLGRLADYGNGKQYFLSTKYMTKPTQKGEGRYMDWKTKSGEKLKISEMTNTHLLNALSYAKRRNKEGVLEY